MSGLTPKAGVYGLDLYSLFNSMTVVVSYLDQVDPEAARRARYRYSCFEQFAEDTRGRVKTAAEINNTARFLVFMPTVSGIPKIISVFIAEMSFV